MAFSESTNYDFILVSKQGRTQLIYSTELLTKHVFEISGEISRLLSPWLWDQLAMLVSIT